MLPSLDIYPKRVEHGGMNALQLLEALKAAKVHLNALGLEFFKQLNAIAVSPQTQLEVIEVSVAKLGFADGATIKDIYTRANTLGFSLCPSDFGAYYRLSYLEQPEGALGFAPTQHRAPPGSVTVASQPISEDDTVPKGFYLRRIEGVLWLRGYLSDAAHLWHPEDVFAFSVNFEDR